MSDAGPLDAAQLAELAAAQERVQGFLGAAKIAAFNGWSVGFFAAVSLLFGLFSLTSLVMGIGLAVVAFHEMKGRRRLLAFEVSGLEMLWRNQVGFLALIVVYCLYSMYRVSTHVDPQMAELTDLLGSGTDELVRDLSLILYISVIAVTVIFQGLNARYYFVRVAKLKAYLSETPAWIVELQRSVTRVQRT